MSGKAEAPDELADAVVPFLKETAAAREEHPAGVGVRG
jgi:hypothetical protein